MPETKHGETLAAWTKEMQGPYSDEQMKALLAKWGYRKNWEVYQNLELSFSVLTSGLPERLTAMAKMSIRDICEWRILREEVQESGDFASAKRISDMIKDEYAKLERMKDSNSAKVDGLVTRLEERGMMQAGKLMLDKVLEYITQDAAHYPMSKDAADQCILLICNTMLGNEGMPTLHALPEDKKLKDALGEFEPTLTEDERKALEAFGCLLPSSVRDAQVEENVHEE